MCPSYYNKSTSGSLSALSQSSSCPLWSCVHSGHGLPRSVRVRRGGRASAGEGGGEAGSGVRVGQPHRTTRRRIIRRAQQEIAGRRSKEKKQQQRARRAENPSSLFHRLYPLRPISVSEVSLALTPPACFTAWIHTCASLSSPCCTPPPAIVLPPHQPPRVLSHLYMPRHPGHVSSPTYMPPHQPHVSSLTHRPPHQPVRVLSHLHATSPSPRVALPPHLHPCTSSTSVTTSFTHRKPFHSKLLSVVMPAAALAKSHMTRLPTAASPPLSPLELLLSLLLLLHRLLLLRGRGRRDDLRLLAGLLAGGQQAAELRTLLLLCSNNGGRARGRQEEGGQQIRGQSMMTRPSTCSSGYLNGSECQIKARPVSCRVRVTDRRRGDRSMGSLCQLCHAFEANLTCGRGRGFLEARQSLDGARSDLLLPQLVLT